MKYFIPFLCFFFFGFKETKAQQPHFVYLQTDNNQPFYVLLKNKNYSSSSIGYVILPKLENGDYRIKVGFAKSEMPEQDYLLKIKDNDQGYLIKNFGEKGSGIFNLQTLAIQYSGEATRQSDAVANAQREAERQKVLLQQRKDSAEKAEAALTEQRKIDNEAKLAAALAQQKENAIASEKQRMVDSIKSVKEAKTVAVNQKKDADALAKKQALDNIRAENEAKLAIAKQRKEAAALAKQQSLDSIKALNAAKIAIARQKVIAKREADSTAAAANPQINAQPKVAETPAQKKVRLAKEAAQKREAALTQDQAKKNQDATTLQNKAAERIRFVSDSLKIVEKNRVQAEQDAAAEKQKRDEDILAKQKASEQAEIAAQKKAAEIAAQNTASENIRKIQDSLNTEKNKAETNETSNPAEKDSSLLIANPTTDHSSPKNMGATIVYEPTVLNRIATDSGTVLTYKIPSSKGWDTVTAFIKAPLSEKKEIPVEKPIEKKIVVENNNPPQADGVKFLDIHFKQDSTNKSNDLITPVFKEDKPAQKTIPEETASENKPAKKQSSAASKISTEKTTPITNSNCRAEANDKDFYALRKKMVAQNDADNMIMVAKKSMREKCYNTLQIRNLSVLLITDADRYQFLEAAYPFTSDAYNYANLADLLKDNYYGDRFKVMLKR